MSKTRLESNISEIREYIEFKPSFFSIYLSYSPDSAILENIRNNVKAQVITIFTFSEYWCPDCLRNVPAMARIEEDLHLINWKFKILNRGKMDLSERKKYKINRIPTFIIFNDQEEEIGRIIENPKYFSLEEDLFRILLDQY